MAENKRTSEWVREELLARLSKAHGFRPASLEVNRSGRLSFEQRRKLLGSLLIGILLMLFTGGISAGFLYALFRAEVGSSWQWFVYTGLVTVGGGYFMWISISVFYEALADMLSGKVACIEGLVEKKRKVEEASDERGLTSTTMVYYYQVGQTSFRVSRRAYDAIVDGLPYRLYYTPRRQVLVGVEPLEQLSNA